MGFDGLNDLGSRPGITVRYALILGLAALAYSGPPALAQPETGSRIDRMPGAVGAVESEDAITARRVMRTYGQCVARNRVRLARALLALPLGDGEQLRTMRRSAAQVPACLGRGVARLQFHPSLLLGAMAEFYVIERMGSRDLRPIAALTDARLAAMGLAPRTGYEDVATCVAVRDPAGVMALIRSEPGTDQESVAFNRLVPHLGPCLPEGLTLTLSPGPVRAIVAVGLYRLLSATAESGLGTSPEREVAE